VEPGVVAIIALIVLIGGTVAVLTRQRPDVWSLPGFRALGVAGAGSADDAIAHDVALGVAADLATEPGSLAARTSARSGAATGLTPRDGEEGLAVIEPLRLDVAPPISPPLAARLDQLEAQLKEMHAAVERQSAQIVRLNSEMQRRAEADEARREAMLERLRADLNAVSSRLTVDRQSGDRRLEVSAELYARLARLESALSAVTNPVLLPGEPYEAPGELLTETLIWENWNEVSERVFALADIFSAQRVHLSEETRTEMGAVITTLRLLLTRSIYPNLHTDLDDAQQDALRAALDAIAAELQNLRGSLDREYRAASGG
jgi:hypothetical protein